MPRAKEAVARTPKATRGRSRSPAVTRSRAKAKNTGRTGARASAAEAERSEHKARGRTPSRRVVKKEEGEDDEEGEDPEEAEEEEEEEDDEEETEEEEESQLQPAAAPKDLAATGVNQDVTTKLVIRFVYMLLMVVGMAAVVLEPGKVESVYASNDGLVIKAFGVSTVALCLQHIAAAQGPIADRKRSLQYGMFTWIMYAGLAVFASAESKGNQPPQHVVSAVIVTSVVSILASLFACYYS